MSQKEEDKETFSFCKRNREKVIIEKIFSQGKGGTKTYNDSSIGSCVRVSVGNGVTH